jgi:hypothetical protein
VRDRLALHSSDGSHSSPEGLDLLNSSDPSGGLPIDGDLAEGLLFLANTAFKQANYTLAEAYCLK